MPAEYNGSTTASITEIDLNAVRLSRDKADGRSKKGSILRVIPVTHIKLTVDPHTNHIISIHKKAVIFGGACFQLAGPTNCKIRIQILHGRIIPPIEIDLRINLRI